MRDVPKDANLDSIFPKDITKLDEYLFNAGMFNRGEDILDNSRSYLETSWTWNHWVDKKPDNAHAICYDRIELRKSANDEHEKLVKEAEDANRIQD